MARLSKTSVAILLAIIAALGAVLAAVLPILLGQHTGGDPSKVDREIGGPPGSQSQSSGSVEISSVNASAPDYVILRNSSGGDIDVSGYALLEGDHRYKLPQGTTIVAMSTRRIWCLKDTANPNDSRPGDLVNREFRIRPGESIKLVDKFDQVVSRVTAN